jgi:hypothetical protein
MEMFNNPYLAKTSISKVGREMHELAFQGLIEAAEMHITHIETERENIERLKQAYIRGWTQKVQDHKQNRQDEDLQGIRTRLKVALKGLSWFCDQLNMQTFVTSKSDHSEVAHAHLGNVVDLHFACGDAHAIDIPPPNESPITANEIECIIQAFAKLWNEFRNRISHALSVTESSFSTIQTEALLCNEQICLLLAKA